MTSRTEPASATRKPQAALAGLRIVVGIWFVKSLFTKVTIALAWGFLPVPAANARWIAVMPKLLAKYAADNPIGWYRDFLLHTVAANPHIFAHLTGVGEAAVGLSLTLGLFTSLGTICGMLQVIFYGLAVQHIELGTAGLPRHAARHDDRVPLCARRPLLRARPLDSIPLAHLVLGEARLSHQPLGRFRAVASPIIVALPRTRATIA